MGSSEFPSPHSFIALGSAGAGKAYLKSCTDFSRLFGFSHSDCTTNIFANLSQAHTHTGDGRQGSKFGELSAPWLERWHLRPWAKNRRQLTSLSAIEKRTGEVACSCCRSAARREVVRTRRRSS